MAIVVKNKDTLQLTLGCSDYSSDILLVENPKASISGAEIDDLEAHIVDNGLLLGNSGSPVTAITDARVLRNEKSILDLS